MIPTAYSDASGALPPLTFPLHPDDPVCNAKKAVMCPKKLISPLSRELPT